MQRMSGLPAERLAEMSEGSRNLARRLNPTIWARNLHEECERRHPGGATGLSRCRSSCAWCRMRHGAQEDPREPGDLPARGAR
jgi:hypothetical protein